MMVIMMKRRLMMIFEGVDDATYAIQWCTKCLDMQKLLVKPWTNNELRWRRSCRALSEIAQ